MPLANNLIGAINLVATLLSIPVIGAGIWLSSQTDNACVKLLQWPLITLGILILVAALSGLVGGFWRVTCLLLINLIAMLILIALLTAFVASTYIVTNNYKGSSHIAPNRTYLEYQLEDYSGWLRKRVERPLRWDGIKSCLASTSMCSELSQRYRVAQDFFNAGISPLQSGCCKPPTACGFSFVNPTYWMNPTNIGEDMDCLLWSNNQTQLCYSCDSCKAGLLENLNRDWRRLNLFLAITLIPLICVYLLGCCAFNYNFKGEGLFHKDKPAG